MFSEFLLISFLCLFCAPPVDPEFMLFIVGNSLFCVCGYGVWEKMITLTPSSLQLITFVWLWGGYGRFGLKGKMQKWEMERQGMEGGTDVSLITLTSWYYKACWMRSTNLVVGYKLISS